MSGKIRKLFAATALMLALLVPVSSHALAAEKVNTGLETTTLDVSVPEEIAGEQVNKLPTYKSADLGTFNNLKDLASAIMNANKSFEPTVSFTYTGSLTNISTELRSALSAATVEPGNDYVHGTLSSWSYQYTTAGKFTMNFTYLGTVEQEKYVTEQVKLIAASLVKPGMTELDKVRAVNDYVITHTVYSKTAKTTPHHVYALLKEGKAVCQAYALLTYRLLTEMGIEARYVVGYAGEGHAWNSVKIDGVWYHLDTTWNDPTFSGSDMLDNISYRYFLVTSETLRKDHTWEEEDYPVATDDRYSYFSKVFMGVEHNGEIYYSDSTNYTLNKLNLKTGNSEQLLNRRVYYLAAYSEFIYFSDYSNGAYLTSYNIVTGNTEVLDRSNVKQLQIVDGYLTYKVGTTTKKYELPLSEEEQEVRNVTLKIAALSEFSSESDLSDARRLYDALTNEQKAKVTNLTKLDNLEKVYPINLAAANAVANIIKNFTTSSPREDLLSVIAQYDSLTAAQQALVSNKNSVLDFKSAISAQNAEIKAVEKAISSLKTTSKTYLEDIKKARTQYDKLKDELKPYVTNYNTLVSNESSVDSAKTAYDLIAALDGSSIEAIVNARKAYDSVPTKLKTHVTNYKTLTSLEANIKNVLAAIKAIDAIDPNSTKFVSQVTTARKAYDKVGSQQNLITNKSKFLTLEKQAQVYNQISKLKATSTKYIQEVTEAKNAYDALGSENQYVTNVSKLTLALEAIKPAKAVIDMIDSIGTDASKIEQARTAYNALDKNSKKYITNLKLLTTKETEYKNVPLTITAINAIDPTGTKFVSQVNSARSLYNKTGSLQSLVTNASSLLAVEDQAKVVDKIAKLKSTSANYVAEVTAAKETYDALTEKTYVSNVAALESAMEAIKPAQAVIKLINDLKDSTSIDAVNEARAAYNNLDKTSVKYITNLKILTTKETEIKSIPAAITAINAIDTSSKNFINQVKAARTAYNKVGSMQSHVTNGKEFVLINKQVEVNDLIAKLKPTSTKYVAEVTAAKAAYDALTEKTYVTNEAKLKTAVEAIKPAQQVIAKIEALDGKSLAKIIEARDAYNALNTTTRKYVTNLKTLTNMEKTYAAPIKVINLIKQTKATSVSSSTFLSKALSMKKAYVALSSENKKLVTNIDDYKELLALYEIKNAQKTRKWTEVTADTFKAIGIDGVTESNLPKIISSFNSLKAGTGTSTVADIQNNVTSFLLK